LEGRDKREKDDSVAALVLFAYFISIANYIENSQLSLDGESKTARRALPIYSASLKRIRMGIIERLSSLSKSLVLAICCSQQLNLQGRNKITFES
jgi:hypothetical protein